MSGNGPLAQFSAQEQDVFDLAIQVSMHGSADEKAAKKTELKNLGLDNRFMEYYKAFLTLNSNVREDRINAAKLKNSEAKLHNDLKKAQQSVTDIDRSIASLEQAQASEKSGFVGDTSKGVRNLSLDQGGTFKQPAAPQSSCRQQASTKKKKKFFFL